jgi:phosphohistidine phosphatase
VKQLVIIRHAKSSWDSPSETDFDRPLNARGHRDAPIMAERLLQKGFKPDAIVSSTANRALTTAQYFAKANGIAKNDIVTVPALYHAMPATFLEVVTSFNDTWQTVYLFSHNPGITAFANMICNVRLDDMPTCGMLGVRCAIEQWKAFHEKQHSFLFFDAPKLVS